MPNYQTDNRQIEDSQTLADIRDYTTQLQADFKERDLDAEAYEQMYTMKWPQQSDPAMKQMRVTIESMPRDAVEGASRLMLANEPTWSIEGDEVGDPELLETELKKWWTASGQIARQPHEHDLVRSGLLYASMDACVNPTADLLEHARKTKSKALIGAAEQTADRTPFLVDVWNPRQGYPAFDIYGLAAYYRKTTMTVADIEARYGKLPDEMTRRGRYQNLTVNLFYDREWYAVWIGGGTGGAGKTRAGGSYDIACKKHKLPAIPIVCQLVDGSMLFDKPEFQRQPILYTLLRSGLWDSMNLYLTMAFTTILAMGVMPKWLHTSPPNAPGKKLEMNWQQFLVELEPGETVQPLLSKGLLDPDAQRLYEMAQGKAEAATIFRQALGAAPTSSGTAFSTVSLLAQAGRLPLIATQKKGGWGIAELGQLMLTWFREQSRYRNGTKLKQGDVPQHFQTTCNLKIQLPQDELQQSNVLRMLTTGEDPLVSKAWGLEHILGIGQPEKMQKEIWDERAAQALYMQTIQQLMREQLAQAESDQQRQMAGARTTGPGGPPQRPPVQQPPSAQPQAGPMMGSPEQAQQIQGMAPQAAGMLPGMGQGMVPPGAQMPGEGEMPNA